MISLANHLKRIPGCGTGKGNSGVVWQTELRVEETELAEETELRAQRDQGNKKLKQVHNLTLSEIQNFLLGFVQ